MKYALPRLVQLFHPLFLSYQFLTRLCIFQTEKKGSEICKILNDGITLIIDKESQTSHLIDRFKILFLCALRCGLRLLELMLVDPSGTTYEVVGVTT